ncbi:MAG: hypothetical protein NC218_08280 [Acetobacter sp.]|nr:hypothetical protein [Acetobacter sp.]
MSNPIIQHRRGALSDLQAGRALYAGEIAVTTDGTSVTDNVVFVGTFEDANTGTGSESHFGYGNVTLLPATTAVSTSGLVYNIGKVNTIRNMDGNAQLDCSSPQYTILGGISSNDSVPSFRQRPILVGPTSDFMSLEKKDEVALKSDLTPYLTAAQAAHAAMPHPTKKVAMTLGASGTVYTPPTDGYFTLEPNTSTALRMITSAMDVGANNPGESYSRKMFIPISSNDTLTVNYTSASLGSGHFNFVYLNGNAPA